MVAARKKKERDELEARYEGPSGKVKLAFDIVRGVFLAIAELFIS